jgi:UDP-N-acetyl-D-galactosamine dehydrogenase
VRGVTFKENCPDIRNSKVFEMVRELKEWGVRVELEDPYADSDEVEKVYGYKVKSKLNENNKYDAIIISVAHKEYKDAPIQNLINYYNIPEKMILGDLKNIYDKNLANKLGFITFCL